MLAEIDCLFRKMENDVSYFDFVYTCDHVSPEQLSMLRQADGKHQFTQRKAYFDPVSKKWVEEAVESKKKQSDD